MHKLKTQFLPTLKLDRDEEGKFLPGHPGMGGRPRGSRGETARLLDSIAAEEAEPIVRAALKDAKEYDGPARRQVLDRVWGKARGRAVAIELPPVEKVADIPKALNAVLMAAARGEVTPGEANTIAATIAVQQRALELAEFEALIESRIARLEQLERRSAPGNEP